MAKKKKTVKAKKVKKPRPKKEKPAKVDGLGPDDLRKIHAAVRQVWSWSYPRRLAIQRAVGKDGFPRCEECKKKVPKVTADHIEPVGEVGGIDYIPRMWCPSTKLKAICPKCHNAKTAEEKKAARLKAIGEQDMGF